MDFPNAIFCARPYYMVRHDRKVTLCHGTWCYNMFLNWNHDPNRFVHGDADAEEILRVLREQEVQLRGNGDPLDAANVADVQVQVQRVQLDVDVDSGSESDDADDHDIVEVEVPVPVPAPPQPVEVDVDSGSDSDEDTVDEDMIDVD